jgi:hypothetical protein
MTQSSITLPFRDRWLVQNSPATPRSQPRNRLAGHAPRDRLRRRRRAPQDCVQDGLANGALHRAAGSLRRLRPPDPGARRWGGSARARWRTRSCWAALRSQHDALRPRPGCSAAGSRKAGIGRAPIRNGLTPVAGGGIRWERTASGFPRRSLSTLHLRVLDFGSSPQIQRR